MSEKYLKQGQRVEVDYNPIHGEGEVLGISSSATPELGIIYIVRMTSFPENASVVIPNETYPYNTLCIPEHGLKVI